MTIDDYLKALRTAEDLIDRHGHTVIVSHTGFYPFAYTVGLTARHQPELIMTGLPAPQSIMILSAAVPTILNDPHAAIGSTYELPNNSTIMPTVNVQLHPCSDTGRLAHLRIAHALYGRDHVTARQLLFADMNRRMPHHPDYQHATLPQPLLDR